MGVIKPAEFNCAIRFKTRPRTSGKNRKLSFFRDFKEIRSNFPVKADIIRDAESDLATNCLERREVLRREIGQQIAPSEARG